MLQRMEAMLQVMEVLVIPGQAGIMGYNTSLLEIRFSSGLDYTWLMGQYQYRQIQTMVRLTIQLWLWASLVMLPDLYLMVAI